MSGRLTPRSPPARQEYLYPTLQDLQTESVFIFRGLRRIPSRRRLGYPSARSCRSVVGHQENQQND